MYYDLTYYGSSEYEAGIVFKTDRPITPTLIKEAMVKASGVVDITDLRQAVNEAFQSLKPNKLIEVIFCHPITWHVYGGSLTLLRLYVVEV